MTQGINCPQSDLRYYTMFFEIPPTNPRISRVWWTYSARSFVVDVLIACSGLELINVNCLPQGKSSVGYGKTHTLESTQPRSWATVYPDIGTYVRPDLCCIKTTRSMHDFIKYQWPEWPLHLMTSDDLITTNKRNIWQHQLNPAPDTLLWRPFKTWQTTTIWYIRIKPTNTSHWVLSASFAVLNVKFQDTGIAHWRSWSAVLWERICRNIYYQNHNYFYYK